MKLAHCILPAALAAALLAGCKPKTEAAPAPTSTSTSTSTSTTAAALPPGAVAVTAGEDGFNPSSVTFKKGAPASLVFTRTTDETCATEVVFPELNVKKELPKGKPVTIEIPTDKEQKLTFQCGMGMYKSAVVIEPTGG